MIEFSNIRNPKEKTMGTIGHGRGDDFANAVSSKIGPHHIRQQSNQALDTIVSTCEAKIDRVLAGLTEFTGTVKVDVGVGVTNLAMTRLRKLYCQNGQDNWGSLSYEKLVGQQGDDDSHIITLNEHGQCSDPMDR